jgi:hypothetical protein
MDGSGYCLADGGGATLALKAASDLAFSSAVSASGALAPIVTESASTQQTYMTVYCCSPFTLTETSSISQPNGWAILLPCVSGENWQ